MFKWLLKLFTPDIDYRDQQLLNNLSEMTENGVTVGEKGNGGWKLHFKDTDAQMWYYRKITRGFENFKIKGE